LEPQDLEDEEFFTYLKNMWKNTKTIDTYLMSKTVVETIYENREIENEEKDE